MRSLVIVTAAVGACLAPAIAAADVPTKLATKPTPVLGDHLEVALPDGMKLEARGHDLMSADQSDQDETRAVLDVGGARFVMMAYERYATAGSDFGAAALAEAKEQTPGAALAPIALAKPLVGFGAAPTVTGADDANVVYVAWIAGGDGSVQLLAFYVNPDGAKAADTWRALAQKIAASAVAGKRVLAAKAGDRVLEDRVITVPDGWVTSTQPGPDFVVFHVRKIAVLGSDGPSCGIYVGGFASYQYAQNGVGKANMTTVRAPLLAAPADWYVWSDGTHTITEAMAKDATNNTVHVFCTTTAAGELGDLRKMAATLRMKPK